MPVAPPSRIVAIGDIHGCQHALETLLGAIAPEPNDRLVVLGDFIDQGRESCGVIELLLDTERRCELICLKGNHEEMLLEALTNEKALRYWEDMGGVSTLNSYRFGGSVGDIPDSHLEFIRRTRDGYETESHIFVHANLDPDIPLSEQSPHALRWSLLEANDAHCHFSGKTAIMGHTEQRNGEILDLGCIKCIDTSCWRYGWLSAMDVNSGTVWQSNRFGMLREPGDRPVGPLNPPLT